MATPGDKNVEDFDSLAQGYIFEEFKHFEDVKMLINSLNDIYLDQIAVETAIERFTYIIDLYQEQPHLLDVHLEYLMERLLDLGKNNTKPEVQHLAFKFLYLLTKMRGAKIIVRLFPHEVADVEPLLALIAKQDPKSHETWESRYILLLWLSMACMIPFDLVRLDSQAVQEDGDCKMPVMDRIYNTAKQYLVVQDKCRDAAAYLMSRFMTRPDVKRQKMPEFIDWAAKSVAQADMRTMTGATQLSGLLASLGQLFKHGKREDLLDYAPKVLQIVQSLNLADSNLTLLRKYGVKVIQRLGLTFLKNRVASWRYQRGSRSLADNLCKDAVAQRQSTMATSNQNQAGEDEEEYDIPDEIEDVIEMLLTALKDRDTIVRWSAAKGIGRLTGRLPQELADDVVGSLMDLFTLQESDGAWHGGCLALAELGRRGLLLPQRLKDVVPVVLKALVYDEKRGNFSIGANVRDSACYVCWAFARAYEPEDITLYVEQIASALVLVSIFDKEVNVRRAASAAFQENVGRQGTFPHGIDILTTCDFHAVGNRSHCYLDLSVFVAQFQEYLQPMIDHLVDIKLHHWDSSMRELTSKALHNLTDKAPEYMAQTVMLKLIPLTTCVDLQLRHGAILCAAEITYAISKWAKQHDKCVVEVLGQDVVDGLKNIAFKMHGAKLYRGIGGEVMRIAVCCLIERLSLSKLPYHSDPVLDLWQETLDECLNNTEPDIQNAAATALTAYFTEYCIKANNEAICDKQDDVINRYLKQLQNSLETTRIGFALALGTLPKFMLIGKLQVVLDGLIQASQITEKEKIMAESRREAVKALTSICRTVDISKDGDPTRVLCSANLGQVYGALFCALKDYTLDSRGDVGAWVREASMVGLQELTSRVVTHQADLLNASIIERIFTSIIQQACEKIDRTRAVAGNAFANLLYHKPPIPYIPKGNEMKNLFKEDEIAFMNWAAPMITFPKFTELLCYPEYTYCVMLGITVSVGGLTESLVKYSSASLQTYLHSISKDIPQLTNFTQVLTQIFRDHQNVDRVSLPLLKMLDHLFAKGSFDAFKDLNHSFPADMLALVKTEITRCRDPQKLLASIDVLCGLLWFHGEVRKKCLSQLAVFLCHRYPLIRKTTANKLYEALISYDELTAEENLDDIMTILSETLWDSSIEEIRPIRNDLCALLDIPAPQLLKKRAAEDK